MFPDVSRNWGISHGRYGTENCGLNSHPIIFKFGQKVYLSKIYDLMCGFFLLSNGCYGNVDTALFLVTIATVAKEKNSTHQIIDLTKIHLLSNFEGNRVRNS